MPDHSQLSTDSDLQSNNSFNEDQSQAASIEQASELDMQEVQHVLDSADERTSQAEQRALKAEEAVQVRRYAPAFDAGIVQQALLGLAVFQEPETHIAYSCWCFSHTSTTHQPACCCCCGHQGLQLTAFTGSHLV